MNPAYAVSSAIRESLHRLLQSFRENFITRHASRRDSKSRCFILIYLFLGSCFFQNFSATLNAATVPVSIGDNFFSPSSVTVNVNDTVTWTWAGANNHSSTSNTGDAT